MSRDARLRKLETAAGSPLARRQVLKEIAHRLNVPAAALESVEPAVWWEVGCAIVEGDLHRENPTEEEWRNATVDQLRRIAAGERPSLVLRRVV